MHAIPAVAMHPDGENFVGQSMDNTLVVYHAERVSGSVSGVYVGARELTGNGYPAFACCGRA